MRIDLAEHSDLVHGASEMEETSEGVRCSRIPGETAMRIFGADGHCADAAKAASGVRIALVTDSSEVSLRLARGRTFAEDGATVDILVDRAECHTFKSDEDAEDFVVSLELEPAGGDEGHEIEIYLPHLSEVLIRDFELSDGSLFRPSYAGDERILFLGGGVTQGAGATSPFRTYPALVAAELHTDFLNWGVRGAGISAELAGLAGSLEWQTAVLACGCGDYLADRPLDAFSAELEKALNKLAARGGVRLFAVTPWHIPAREDCRNQAGATPADYRKAAEKIIRQVPDVTPIDGMAACGRGRKAFTEDKLLPADAGMAAIAEAVHRKLSAGA